jgi:hypothetical protein
MQHKDRTGSNTLKLPKYHLWIIKIFLRPNQKEQEQKEELKK